MPPWQSSILNWEKIVNQICRIFFLVVGLTSGLLTGMTTALGQAEQIIVLDCLPPGHAGDVMNVVTLDLASKIVTYKTSTPNPGGSPDPIAYKMQGPLTDVSDRQFRWTYTSLSAVPGFNPSFGNGIFTLDRYTGIMTEDRGSDPGNTYISGPVQCHRQQKQF